MPSSKSASDDAARTKAVGRPARPEAIGPVICLACEGDTEVVFYETYLKRLADRQDDLFWRDAGDDERCWYAYGTDGGSQSKARAIYLRSMGSIGDMPKAAVLIDKVSRLHGKSRPKTMFLCHDTDGKDPRRFYERDWNRMRRAFRDRNVRVVDLQADGDIEAEMLLDLPDIFGFLGISSDMDSVELKGKKRMKSLFRTAGLNYREGYRARPLIESLDMEVIRSKSNMPLCDLESAVLTV